MTTHERNFIETVWQHYKNNRRMFPWRATTDPYAILVSEMMLQQTQTDRVIPKYIRWLKKFPTFHALAQAKLQTVLKEWQGLGYNRRALALQRLAHAVVKNYAGKLPQTYEKLVELPGIGPYTAGAVLAFAFNMPVPIIETNIRTVYIHHFFPKEHGEIHDKELLALIEKTLDRKNPREWYWALMDYGAYLKKTLGNMNTRSKHYTKQSAFIGSNRQIRSSILRIITEKQSSEKIISRKMKQENISATPEQILKNIYDLEHEGFIKKIGTYYTIV